MTWKLLNCGGYGFSVYDDLVALMVSGYLKTVDRKLALRKIVDPRVLAVDFEEGTASALYTEVDGKALAALLEPVKNTEVCTKKVVSDTNTLQQCCSRNVPMTLNGIRQEYRVQNVAPSMDSGKKQGVGAATVDGVRKEEGGKCIAKAVLTAKTGNQ